MTTIELPRATDDPAFWLGWLGSAVADALRKLEEADVAGYRTVERDEVIRDLRLILDLFCESEVARRLCLDGQRDRTFGGFAVVAATGELQAVRDTYDDADMALDEVESYWDLAAANGGSRHVARLRPFTVRQITRAERDEADEHPAVIDREP